MNNTPSVTDKYPSLDYRTLVEDSLIGIYLVQGDRFLYVNRALAELFGYTPEEVVETLRVGDLVTGEDRELVLGNIRRRIAGEVPRLRYTFRGKRRDGSVLEVEVLGSRVETEQGPAVLGTLLDLTERNRERDRLDFLARASEVLDGSLHYETTLESLARLTLPVLADYCLIDMVEGGRIRRMVVAHTSPEREKQLRSGAIWSMEDDAEANPVIGVLRTGTPVLVPEVTPEVRSALERDERDGVQVGELRPGSFMIVPLIARDHILGAITLAAAESGRRFGSSDLAFAKELARRAALSVDNARLYREAQDAIETREDVLAIVSHDLRSPLNVISMCTQMLIDQERRKNSSLEMIDRAAKQMERLIRDLLDTAAMDTGRLTISVEPRALDPLVEAVAASLRPRAEEQSIVLETRVADDLPLVLADPDRVQQVLWNLIGNALKFTPEGGRIRVGAVAEGDVVHLSVSDTGPGIPGDQLSSVFGRFVQLGPGDGRGVGLGLAIVRGIVEAHGGRVWVESEPGDGTTFHFTLPAAPAAGERVGSAA